MESRLMFSKHQIKILFPKYVYIQSQHNTAFYLLRDLLHGIQISVEHCRQHMCNFLWRHHITMTEEAMWAPHGKSPQKNKIRRPLEGTVYLEMLSTTGTTSGSH